jgi:hypothetical protein
LLAIVVTAQLKYIHYLLICLLSSCGYRLRAMVAEKIFDSPEARRSARFPRASKNSQVALRCRSSPLPCPFLTQCTAFAILPINCEPVLEHDLITDSLTIGQGRNGATLIRCARGSALSSERVDTMALEKAQASLGCNINSVHTTRPAHHNPTLQLMAHDLVRSFMVPQRLRRDSFALKPLAFIAVPENSQAQHEHNSLRRAVYCTHANSLLYGLVRGKLDLPVVFHVHRRTVHL